MKTPIIQDLLLISDPSIIRLHAEMNTLAGYFFLPCFLIALILEYFGEMDFASVVKRLLIGLLTLSIFYKIHTEAVSLSFEQASITLKKVSPQNLFVKKWTDVKLKTKEDKLSGSFTKFFVPNLNDMLATAFFLLAKVFLWLLKLIFSSVYHLTYIFSGVSGVLYLFGWTKNALKGSVQASLWCILMPFVIVAILTLVGNSFSDKAQNGELLIAQMDNILWLFGVTLLLLLSPIITQGLVQGEGFHSYGAKFGSQIVGAGMKAPLILAASAKIPRSFSDAKNSLSRAMGLKAPSNISSGIKATSTATQNQPGSSFYDQQIKSKEKSKETSNIQNSNTKTNQSGIKSENKMTAFVNKESLLKHSASPSTNKLTNALTPKAPEIKPELNAKTQTQTQTSLRQSQPDLKTTLRSKPETKTNLNPRGKNELR